MGIYSKTIFPVLLEMSMSKPSLAKLRKQLLSEVNGKILEVGFGTGENLKYYPEHVQKITVIDINDELGKKAKEKILESVIDVDYQKVSADQLPFDNNSFDCIVSTFTFCSILNIEKAVAEYYRVLKSGGKLFFLEHGKSSDKKVCFFQNLINPIFKRVACDINRDIEAIIKTQEFKMLTMKKFYHQNTMKITGFLYMGVCQKLQAHK